MSFNFDEKKIAYWKFLFELRDSGLCNMFESAEHLERNFQLSRTEAETIMVEWMENCGEIQEEMQKKVADQRPDHAVKVDHVGHKVDDTSSDIDVRNDINDINDDSMSGDDDNTDDNTDHNARMPHPQLNSYWNNKGKYQAEYDRLYKKYVPFFGKTDSPQGNILRLVSKIYYRCYNDGDTDMSEYEWLLEEAPIPADIDPYFHDVFGDFSSSSLEDMCDVAIEYALQKEKEDREKRPEVDAMHENRLAEALRKDAEWKIKMEREKEILSPIRTSISKLNLKEARSALTKKNIKAQKITSEDISYILRGIDDHVRDVTFGSKVTKNGPAFGKMMSFLIKKGHISKSMYSDYDYELMCKTYPRTKTLLT